MSSQHLSSQREHPTALPTSEQIIIRHEGSYQFLSSSTKARFASWSHMMAALHEMKKRDQWIITYATDDEKRGRFCFCYRAKPLGRELSRVQAELEF